MTTKTVPTPAPGRTKKRAASGTQAAASGAVDPAETRASTGGASDPPSRLRLPLRTVDDVKAELARLYREGKAGRRDIADVSKLAHVLSLLGRLIEGSDFEARIRALEGGRN